MTDAIPTYLLMGWEIEALPGGIVHCRLKIAHNTEAAKREDFRLVPLGIPAAQCLDLAQGLRERAEQSLTREKPAIQ